MKREIDCASCARSWAKQTRSRWNGAAITTSANGENIKILPGVALHIFSCDGCGLGIAIGDLCFGVSVWADCHGIPWHPWEGEYLRLLNGTEIDALQRLRSE